MISLKHATLAVGSHTEDGELGNNEWNAEHVLTMGAGFVVGRTDAGDGLAQELSFAALAAAGGYLTSVAAADISDISANGASLITAANYAAMRGLLDVDQAGTDNSTAVTLAGEDYLSLSGQQITAAAIDLDNLSATGTRDATTYLRGDNTFATISSGSGDTINNFATLGVPQRFNPDAAAVTANTDDFTVSGTNAIAFVTLDGLVLDDSEYSLASTTLTVTPINGFSATDQEVLVFQYNFSDTSSGGSTKNYTQVSATYTILPGDHYVEATANTFTITLPTAVGIAGKSYQIKNTGAGIVTVDGSGSETIDGSTTATLATNEAITVVSNGTNWKIF